MAGGPRTVPLADADDGKVAIVWNFGFKTRADDMTLGQDQRLVVTSSHTFVDGSGRPPRTETQVFEKAP